MSSTALRAAAILMIGSVLGLGSAAAAIWFVANNGAVHVGPWVTPLDAGGAERGLYLRAAIALRATLGLSRREALYFAASTDSEGYALRGDCSYKLTGPDLPARWWSITLYGADHYLIANAENRWSYASANVAHDADGAVTIWIGPDAHQGNWLDTGHANGLVLLTRLYQPSTQAAAHPAEIKLPNLVRQSCRS